MSMLAITYSSVMLTWRLAKVLSQLVSKVWIPLILYMTYCILLYCTWIGFALSSLWDIVSEGSIMWRTCKSIHTVCSYVINSIHCKTEIKVEG